MEKDSITIEKLNAVIASAINNAIDARETKKKVLVKRKDTAKRLHVDLSTLWRWSQVGYLTPIKIGGRLWYSEEAIERLERGEMEA